MKRFTFKVLATFVITMFVLSVDAQLTEIKMYCSDDWTVDDGHPDDGIDWGNNLCNNDDDGTNGNGYQEAWIKWDLSSIVLEGGEQVISAEVLLRGAYNYQEQGYQAIILDDIYDSWIETNFNWNQGLALGNFITEGGDTAIVVPIANQFNNYTPGEYLVTEKFSVLQYVVAELAGNQEMTMRLKPYYDTFNETPEDKKWLGFYNRQPHSTWDQTMADPPNDDISAWTPYLKLKIGVPTDQFSTIDMPFGNINNYNLTPNNEWFAVEDEAGNGRLLMLKNNSNNPDSIGATAIYANNTNFSDFDLTLDARVNDALTQMKTNVSIIFDYTDELNYSYYSFYGVPESGSEELNGVYRVTNGVRTAVGVTIGGIAIMDDEYHTYSVKREGQVVTASVDGTIFHVVDDASLSGNSGSIGFGSGKYLVNFDNVQEASTVNIDNINRKQLLNIYPNPAKSSVSIINEKKIDKVEILDITGKCIHRIGNINSNRVDVDLSGLNKGIYIILTESDGIINAGKLIKE